MQVGNPFADVSRNDLAHEKLAGAGGGNSAAFIIGIGTSANDGRIAHADGHFHLSLDTFHPQLRSFREEVYY